MNQAVMVPMSPKEAQERVAADLEALRRIAGKVGLVGN
jgi:hypothetical protein